MFPPNSRDTLFKNTKKIFCRKNKNRLQILTYNKKSLQLSRLLST